MAEEKKLTGYPSIDKPWLKYYANAAEENHLQGRSVFQNIYDTNASHPEDTALEYYGRKITYHQLFDSVERTKNALVAFGVKENDKVILFTSSTPETVYIVLALCRIGAVADMINPLFTDEECIERINETQARSMIVLDQLYDRIAASIPKTCIQRTIVIPLVRSMPLPTRILAGIKLNKRIGYNDTVVRWSTFLKAGGDSIPDTPYEKDRPLVMVYSSGSTGASKGIVLTNDGINATIRHYISPDLPYERGYTFLQMIPVWFSTGIVLSVLMPLCIGITVILEPVFSKESFASDLKKYDPHMTLTATSLWVYVMDTCTEKSFRITNMRYPATGGEKVLPRVEKALNAFLRDHGSQAPLLTAYGMCELGSTITTDSDTYHKIGASGYPMTGVVVAAFDPASDRELKYGERGELRVCSPARMKGYFKNPEATEAFFRKDSEGRVWGCTGDIGYVDEDGFIFVLGRAKDHFHRENGELVYWFDIEDAILQDDAVAQCKVVYFKTGETTETVAHMVLREKDADPVPVLRRIHRRLTDTLPDYMVPHYYKVRGSMPVHNNGKLDARALREERDGLIPAEELQ